jgi:hypothetical protein
MYTIQLWSLKLAFLTYYFDLVQHLGKTVRLVLYGATVYTAAAFLTNLLLLFTFCLPMRKNWLVPIRYLTDSTSNLQ